VDTAQEQNGRKTPAFLKYSLAAMGIAVSAALVIIPLSELNNGPDRLPIKPDHIVVAELPEVSRHETPTVSSNDTNGTIIVNEQILRDEMEYLDSVRTSTVSLNK
jgi:hypothetical protein